MKPSSLETYFAKNELVKPVFVECADRPFRHFTGFSRFFIAHTDRRRAEKISEEQRLAHFKVRDHGCVDFG